MKQYWQTYFSKKNSYIIFVASVVTLTLILFVFLHFLTYNEFRKGYIFNDPILNLIHPIDVSIYTFLITYSFSIAGLFIALLNPILFIQLIQGYSILITLRMICMFMLPLEAPIHIIPLKDIFLNASFYSGRENLKDLFFSGHTAILFLFAFYFKNKTLKILFMIGGLIIALLLITQHVHYIIDVLAAPLFAYFSFSAQRKINLY